MPKCIDIGGLVQCQDREPRLLHPSIPRIYDLNFSRRDIRIPGIQIDIMLATS